MSKTIDKVKEEGKRLGRRVEREVSRTVDRAEKITKKVVKAAARPVKQATKALAKPIKRVEKGLGISVLSKPLDKITDFIGKADKVTDFIFRPDRAFKRVGDELSRGMDKVEERIQDTGVFGVVDDALKELGIGRDLRNVFMPAAGLAIGGLFGPAGAGFGATLAFAPLVEETLGIKEGYFLADPLNIATATAWGPEAYMKNVRAGAGLLGVSEEELMATQAGAQAAVGTGLTFFAPGGAFIAAGLSAANRVNQAAVDPNASLSDAFAMGAIDLGTSFLTRGLSPLTGSLIDGASTYVISDLQGLSADESLKRAGTVAASSYIGNRVDALSRAAAGFTPTQQFIAAATAKAGTELGVKAATGQDLEDEDYIATGLGGLMTGLAAAKQTETAIEQIKKTPVPGQTLSEVIKEQRGDLGSRVGEVVSDTVGKGLIEDLKEDVQKIMPFGGGAGYWSPTKMFEPVPEKSTAEKVLGVTSMALSFKNAYDQTMDSLDSSPGQPSYQQAFSLSYGGFGGLPTDGVGPDPLGSVITEIVNTYGGIGRSIYGQSTADGNVTAADAAQAAAAVSSSPDELVAI
jgi:hypothetical protein